MTLQQKIIFKRILLGILVLSVSPVLVFFGYRYYRSMNVVLQKVEIHLTEGDWSTIDSLNRRVVNTQLVNSSYKEYVPAFASMDNQNTAVKIRLKGDKMDHYTTTPPSFRVKVKKDQTLFGTNKLSLQAITSRNFPMEWMYHKLLASEDILSLNMDIVELKINDIETITTFEEHFTHFLTDRFNRPRGTILCISESLFWDKFQGLPSMEEEEALYLTSPIKVLDDGLAMDSIEIIKSIALFDDYRNQRKPVQEVFDVKKLALFVALSELCNAHHALRWHNTRYYYNPQSKRLEPIGFDATIGTLKKKFLFDDELVKAFSKEKLFKSRVFLTEYFKCLEKVSSEKFIDSFLQKEESGIDDLFSKTYKSDLFYKKTPGFLHWNAKWIRANLVAYKKRFNIE